MILNTKLNELNRLQPNQRRSLEECKNRDKPPKTGESGEEDA